MVVVVSDSRFKARRVTGRLDPPHQTGVRARAKHVVDGLGGNRTESLPDRRRDLVGRGVRMIGEPLEHGHPRRGDPETGRFETLSHEALLVCHNLYRVARFLE
jgi:hypothetical protein